MSGALFRTLAAWLAEGPVVLASVLATRGATPRKAGARMLIAAGRSHASIGGGLAESRVIAAAMQLLAGGEKAARLDIDLRGGAESAGVCGGQMALALRRWEGAEDLARATGLADTLAGGLCIELEPAEVGAGEGRVRIEPDPRLLIVGGGHCGHALYQLAAYLDLDIWVHDPRPEWANASRYPAARVLAGDWSLLEQALEGQRRLLVVLLNRDFPSDVACLRALAAGLRRRSVEARAQPAFLGMMGSQRRIHQVLGELGPEEAELLGELKAPVGIEIGAETPHEIAISILAQLIACQPRWVHPPTPILPPFPTLTRLPWPMA